MKKYIISVREEKNFTAGSKAREDAEAIAKEAGYEPFLFKGDSSARGNLLQQIRLLWITLQNWIRLAREAEPGSLVLMQYPYFPLKTARLIRWMIPWAKKQKNLIFIFLIHDLNSLRGIYGKTCIYSDHHLLQQADFLIAHNDRMKEYLVRRGISADRVIILKIFDYLTEAKPKTHHLQDGIVIAGNLNPDKCGYVGKLDQLPFKNTAINLYGRGHRESFQAENVFYQGKYPAEELPEKMKGGFGLVWDGTDITSCKGDMGAYLRFNNPHKLSLYLASNMPVIIWKEAAEAKYVLEHGVGITVDSLMNLEQKLQTISEEKYRQMCAYAQRVGTALRNGLYLKSALQKTELLAAQKTEQTTKETEDQTNKQEEDQQKTTREATEEAQAEITSEKPQRKSIRWNFLMNALLAVSGVIFPLISFRYVSRILGPDGVGTVSFATSIVAYFSMFAQLGIPTYGIRACAKVRDDKEALSRTVHELLGINLVMDLVSYVLLALAVLCIPRLGEEKLLFTVLSATIFLNSIGMEWLYKGLEEYTYITARSLIFKVIALFALFLLVHQESDYILYGGVSIFAASASNILNFIHSRNYISLYRPKGCDWKKHLKPVLVFFAMACATTIYTNLDSAMLGFMTTDTDVGYYAAAVKVKMVLGTLVTSLGAVLLPRSSWNVEHGEMAIFRQTTRKALRFVIPSASALTVFFILYAKECVLFLSGEEFLPAVPAMQIILPTLICIGLSNILGIQILVPLGREKVVLQSEIGGVITDLILNLLLIPRWGAAGAAVGTLAAEAVVTAIQYAALRNELKNFFREYKWLRLLFALLIAAGAGFWVHFTGWEPVPILILAACFFFGAYGAFLAWRQDEIMSDFRQLLITALRRNKA